jgi:hypothetical protein
MKTFKPKPFNVLSTEYEASDAYYAWAKFDTIKQWYMYILDKRQRKGDGLYFFPYALRDDHDTLIFKDNITIEEAREKITEHWKKIGHKYCL